MQKSESIKEIAPALLKAQKSIGIAKKSAKNPFFKSSYADLSSVMEVCKKPFNDNGITVLQPIVQNVVETVLLHESGEWISSETNIVSKEPDNPQAYGSATSYARRYGLQSFAFIPAEDDDAESASGRQAPPTPKAGYSTATAASTTPELKKFFDRIDASKSHAELDVLQREVETTALLGKDKYTLSSRIAQKRNSLSTIPI